jgi:hypothetical protein
MVAKSAGSVPAFGGRKMPKVQKAIALQSQGLENRKELSGSDGTVSEASVDSKVGLAGASRKLGLI